MFRPDWSTYLHRFKEREAERIFARCPRHIFPNTLELGAGDGFGSALLTRYSDCVVATDYGMEIFRNPTYASVTYQQCDAERCDKEFPQQTFDLVISSNTLEHVPHPDNALRAVHALLKDDGIAIHAMPTRTWKTFYLLLYYPSLALTILNNLLRYRSLRQPKHVAFENNQKTMQQTKGAFQKIAFPQPHGVSKNHLQEYAAFSAQRWIALFQETGFEVIRVVRGPFATGHGFGIQWLDRLIERFGGTAENIFIAQKHGHRSRYSHYFL